MQFNAYLAAIERDLPQQDEAASAMTFYSKLSKELKQQFKSSDIPIPDTRAKCIAIAQCIWEGLNLKEPLDSATSSYFRISRNQDPKD
jgi:hypothetical protein